MTASTLGIAVLCTLEGTILEFIRQGWLPSAGGVGQPFESLLEPASREKARLFLSILRSRGATFGWELNVPIGQQSVPLYFAGALNGARLVIIGGPRRGDRPSVDRSPAGQAPATLSSTPSEPPDGSTQDLFDWESLCNELSGLNNELTTAHRELARRKVELDRLNRLKNYFLGIAAHDLRSPLGVIQINIQLLLHKLEAHLDTRNSECFSRIQSAIQFMVVLINDFLDITKIEAGEIQLKRTPTDIQQLIERSVSLNRQLAEREQVRLILTAQGSLPHLPVDALKIEQVLNNLMANAITFSPPGGVVEIGATVRGEHLVIWVRDQGPGIAPDEVEQLFLPFRQGQAKHTKAKKGSGLGLAIAAKLVERHGGTLSVESQPGCGSTFLVSLPLDAG